MAMRVERTGGNKATARLCCPCNRGNTTSKSESRTNMTKGVCCADWETFSSGSPFESTFDFSRALRVGKIVFFSGCTAVQSGGAVGGVADACARAVKSLKTVETSWQQAGASMKDVVGSRIFSADLSGRPDPQEKHSAKFSSIFVQL